MSHKEQFTYNIEPLGQFGYQQRRQIMKWLITILTIALTTTGCMLESPDPCDSSPVSCDVAVDTRPAKPSTPSLSATSGTEAITINFDAPRAEYHFVHYSETLPVGTQNQFKSTGTSHTFTGLDPNKEYHFSVTAVNSRGISPVSTTVTSQPKTIATSPTVSPTTIQYSYLDCCEWC